MEVIGTRTVRDDYDAIKDAILKGVKTADLVVTTGGTSAGERDYVYRVVKEMGEMIFHGIRFKPGKPTFVGRINDIPIIGLPGNMVSTIMVYRKIVRPSLERKFKIKARERITVKAKSLLEIKADKKRFTYIPVLLFRKSSEYYALPLKFDSYMIGTFSMANGYIGLSEGFFVNEEDEVTVEVTNPPGDTTIVGEEDPAVPSTGIYYPLGSLPALKMLEKKVGDVLVLSSLVKVPDDFDLEIKREILSNGQGAEIGYDEWVSLSKYVKNPSVKLRYRSLIKRFIGKAKVIGPSSYVQSGNEVGTESLFVIAVTEMGKQLIKSFKVNKST
ncbi:molybdopterin-binding protein [Sulfuracidifex tepidarius]|nr:molybdopterin-binding protein [Sulfuracidifex tepidarius]